MSDWNAGAADYLTELGRRTPARSPATIGEIWDSEWKRSGLDTIGGIGRPLSESYDELRGAIEKHSGGDLAGYAAQQGVLLTGVNIDERVGQLNKLADTLPEAARKEIEPLRDVRRRASDKAQQIERDAADISASTYGLTGHATAFLAGVARQAVDPVNLAANVATAPLGGTFSGPVLKVIARQAAAGAAAQLVVEPYVQAGRGELGLESGFAHGAMDVGQAAFGAGGLAALLRAGGAGLRMLRAPAVARPAGEAAPAFEPTFLGYMDHEAAAAFERGEPLQPTVPLTEGVPDTLPGFTGTFDIAAAERARPTRTREPDAPLQTSDYAPDYFTAEHAAAFDRGQAYELAADTPIDAVRVGGGEFTIGEAAGARPTRTRVPDLAPQTSDYAPDFFTAEHAAAFERGAPLQETHALGDTDVRWRAFEGLSTEDLNAAAHLAERDQLIDAAAPSTWDRAAHHAMVDEAAAALEAGRPIDRTKAADKLEAAGLPRPEVVPIADPVIAAAKPVIAELLRLEKKLSSLSEASAVAVETHGKHSPQATAAFDAVDEARAAHAAANEKLKKIQLEGDKGLAGLRSSLEASPPAKTFGVHKTPEEKLSLFQYLASRGGVRLDDPLISDLQSVLGTNPFVPGFGQLMRKPAALSTAAQRSGRSAPMLLDAARELATMAGYLPEKSTVRDLIDAINLEARGDKQYRAGQTPAAKLDPTEQKGLREQARVARETEFDDRMKQLEITKLTKADRSRALQIMEKEGQPDPLLAYEQALAEKEAAKEKLRARRLQETDLHIPGFDVADEPGAASQVGGDPAGGTGARSGEREAGGPARGAGEGAGAAGESSQLGDPAVAADFDRLLEQNGGDVQATIRQPDGTLQSMSAREALDLAEDDARAAAELFDCAGAKPEIKT